MIKHIVMWKLKQDALGKRAAENANAMKQMLDELDGIIPELKRIEVSVDVRASAPECDVVLYSEFENMQDLDAYQVHPAHLKCVEFIKQIVSERRVVDYAI
ncbi:MAG: Dabb family protein [Desulfovibrionaceae bacterium]